MLRAFAYLASQHSFLQKYIYVMGFCSPKYSRSQIPRVLRLVFWHWILQYRVHCSSPLTAVFGLGYFRMGLKDGKVGGRGRLELSIPTATVYAYLDLVLAWVLYLI